MTNFQAIFKTAFEGEKPSYQPLVMTVKSDSDKESYNWLGAVPAPLEWKDERTIQGLRSQSYTVLNTNYEVTIEVDRNTLEDDKYGLIAPRIKQLAIRVANHPNKLAFSLLNAGASTKTYDGVEFFKANREIGDSGVINNIAAGAYAADSAKILAGISKAIEQMMAFCDDQGEPIGLIPDTVVCSPKMLLAIKQALKPTVGGTTLAQADIIKDVIASGYLTSGATAGHDYYVVCTSAGELKPLLLQMRKTPEFVAVDKPDSHDVFMRRKLLYGVDGRYGVALLEPRTAVLVDCSD
jgi:phage major head subunit gpT-like protein